MNTYCIWLSNLGTIGRGLACSSCRRLVAVIGGNLVATSSSIEMLLGILDANLRCRPMRIPYATLKASHVRHNSTWS